MKLILTADDGEVLDSVEVTREDWDDAQRNSQAALGLLSELRAGDSAGHEGRHHR
jgi:hypothetical protein